MNRIDRLKAMLIESPEDCFLLHALGLEFVKIHEPGEAVEAFEQVILTDPDYVGTYYHLAQTYFRMGEFEKAKKVFLQGIEVAGKLKDNHARNELQMAVDELFED